MVIMHRMSGSTTYLLKGIRPIHGKNIKTFDDIVYFYNNYHNIFNDTECALNNQIDVETRQLIKKEQDLTIIIQQHQAIYEEKEKLRLEYRRNKIHNTLNPIDKTVNAIKYFIDKISSQYRIESSISPFKRDLIASKDRKDFLVNNKARLIDRACKNIIDSYRYLSENNSYLLGAEGEEKVIQVLKGLSNEYYVINDVQLHFSRPIYWKKYDEQVRSCQIDHMVIGPTGVFILETKNWNTLTNDGLNNLEYQLERQSLALWYYFKNILLLDNIKINKVGVLVKGTNGRRRIGSYIDLLSIEEVCYYLNNRNNVYSKYECEYLFQKLLNV